MVGGDRLVRRGAGGWGGGEKEKKKREKLMKYEISTGCVHVCGGVEVGGRVGVCVCGINGKWGEKGRREGDVCVRVVCVCLCVCSEEGESEE